MVLTINLLKSKFLICYNKNSTAFHLKFGANKILRHTSMQDIKVWRNIQIILAKVVKSASAEKYAIKKYYCDVFANFLWNFQRFCQTSINDFETSYRFLFKFWNVLINTTTNLLRLKIRKNIKYWPFKSRQKFLSLYRMLRARSEP